MPTIHADQPLAAASALIEDKLDRAGFARSVVSALSRVSVQSGFVVSIEGAWGSGKTSTLALVESLLGQVSTKRPIVVRFNPWLVGDRDALLRHFLATIASAIAMGDMSLDAKKAAKELNTYAKVFDFVKLVPGAEPWASLVKSVIEAAGNATEAVADYKTPDIEERKRKVESALRTYDRPVVVFVDDIDRLFPQEVFEMVRIIKAVGELPNLGYLLAWDAAYVKSALETLGLPKPATYLDKIVQVRLPLPSLSNSAREQLMNDSLERLEPEALKSHFPSDGERLSELYFSGLRELLEQPRDFVRLFNTVGVLEPSLRGELALADIVGYAALLVKAPDVAELLRRQPRLFVGKLDGDGEIFKTGSEVVEEGGAEREEAYSRCANTMAVKELVHYLFPAVEEAEAQRGFARTQYVEGHIASPSRLLVALQLSISPGDVSLVKARRFLSQPGDRSAIASTLTESNCVDFIECLADVGNKVGRLLVSDLVPLCLAIAELADSPPCVNRAVNRRSVIGQSPDGAARQTISEIVEAIGLRHGPEVADAVIRDRRALSVAAGVVASSYLKEERAEGVLFAAPESKEALLKAFADNVRAAADDGALMKCARPMNVLWILSRAARTECPVVFASLRTRDASLDSFATAILKNSFNSVKGQTFALDEELVSAFLPVEEFRRHAIARLGAPGLDFPARAAWSSVVTGKQLYAIDGSEVD